jgi:hypothetical protein
MVLSLRIIRKSKGFILSNRGEIFPELVVGIGEMVIANSFIVG